MNSWCIARPIEGSPQAVAGSGQPEATNYQQLANQHRIIPNPSQQGIQSVEQFSKPIKKQPSGAFPKQISVGNR